MVLCSLCSTIPFGSLPDHPPDKGLTLAGDMNECPVLIIDPEHKEPYGFPWHQDLNSLAESASSCPLCAIVQEGFQKWLGYFEESQRKPFYAEFKETYAESVPHGQRLFLTRRYGGGPGFIVLARETTRRWSSLYLLTGVVFSVRKENPAFQELQLQPPELDSGSMHSLNIAGSFLAECQEKHERCSTKPVILPSRVIDTGLENDVVKLIEPRGQSGTYACLSHCWGGELILATTQETIQRKKTGIPLDELPKTFLDAVKIVRHLGIRYIWIDSLCIVQDDADDWARESARMHDVYSNAHLTIAANHASKPSEGCFHIRSPRPSCDVDLPGYASNVHIEMLFVSDEMDWEAGEFLSEPLSRRGWALQERILSQRTLHYNTRQMYYECNHGIVGEDGCHQERMLCSLDALFGLNKGEIVKRYDIDPSPDSHSATRIDEILSIWDAIVWKFGHRKLTNPSDKLPATSGFSKLFEKHLRCQYVAGFWSDSLIQSLSWRALGREKYPVHNVGPSWSWVSYPGVAANGHGSRLRPVTQLLEWKVEFKNESNPYGEINSAWIRVRGPVTPLLSAKVDYTDVNLRMQKLGYLPHPLMRTPYSENDEEVIQIELDHEEVAGSEKWKEMDLHLLLLSFFLPESETDTDNQDTPGEEDTDELESTHMCLVVTGDARDPGRMKRVGLARVYGPLAKRIRADETNCREVILV
ncbi:transcription activator of gluconeogenesis [Apiospora arundinis]